jgi:hypothetical protein
MFTLEGRVNDGRRWTALARADSHGAAVKLFSEAKRRYPGHRFFRMRRSGRIIWKISRY